MNLTSEMQPRVLTTLLEVMKVMKQQIYSSNESRPFSSQWTIKKIAICGFTESFVRSLTYFLNCQHFLH